MLVEDGARILIDVTRHFTKQAAGLQQLDAVLLTHGHRDACGGIAQLRRWRRERDGDPLPVYASAETIAAVRRRFSRLDHCRFVPVRGGAPVRCGPWSLTALEVPHSGDERYPTFAWKLRARGTAIVYVSDVARLTGELRRFTRSATVLVLDAAMWRRRIFSHLTIDEALPEVCQWSVGEILLTQIGRSVPPHEALGLEAARLCARARPAYDGMTCPLRAPSASTT